MLKEDKYLWRVASARDYTRVVIASQCWEWNPRTYKRWFDSTSCCLCHRDMRKNVRKVGISNAKLGSRLLCVLRTLLQFCGNMAIRHNVDFIHIYQHFWRFNAILKCYIRSINAFERLTFTTQKQIVSNNRINQSIDIDTYL